VGEIILTTDWTQILPGVEMRIIAPAFYLAGVKAEIRFTDIGAVRRNYYPESAGRIGDERAGASAGCDVERGARTTQAEQPVR
jgi:hypothetical protein